MSFILDALKKSESDRQRQSGPSLFEVKVAPPRRTLPIWAVAIVVLLAINVVVISWMLLRHPAAQQPAGAASAGAVPAAVPEGRIPLQDTASARAAVGAPMRSPASGPAAAGAPAAPAAAATQAAAPAGTAMQGGAAAAAASTQPRGAAPPAVAPPVASGADQSAGEPPAGDNPADYAPAVEPGSGSGGSAAGAADLPLYQQIVTSDGLPALHLDLHVFASRPRDRFVMINMHRLGEGDSLPGGVEVEEIRSDGVVLTYHGTRFLLPRN